MPSFGDEIASLVVETFEGNQLKGKPQIKSNGVREWTVVAGIVAVHWLNEADYSLDLIAITTGVKSLPDDLIRRHSEGKLLHDCHAEVLALRAFNRFITSECLKDQSNYVHRVAGGDKFELKSSIEFALYVSEPPCGDCSLELLHDDRAEDEASWVDVAELSNGVIRGRDNYKLTGRVRTKPGRRDSPLSLSKSCSDKLCLSQRTSILSCVTRSFMDPVYLRYLVVAEERYNKDSFKRCFKDRFDVEGAHYFQVLTSSKKCDWFSQEGAVPSNRSLIYIPSEPLQESIVNSMKEGFYSKRLYLRPHGESKLSRYQLWKHCEPIVKAKSTATSTYLDFKQSQSQYQSIKAMAQLALKHWCQTATDDFDI